MRRRRRNPRDRPIRPRCDRLEDLDFACNFGLFGLPRKRRKHQHTDTMKTTKSIILIAAAFVIANLLSCTLTSNPDGSFSAAVDATKAAAIATKIIAEK